MSRKTTALEKLPVQEQSTAAEIVDSGFAMARLGQEATFHAARAFVDLVDTVLPVQGGEDSIRRELIDSAFHLADQAAVAQLRAVRSVVHRPHLPFVNLDLQAFTFEGVDVDVAVSVPTDVGAFNSKRA